GSVAGIASHAAIRMCQLRVVRGNSAPGPAIFLDRLRPSRFFAVMRISRRDGIQSLHNFPFLIGFDHRPLVELAILPFESPAIPWSAKSIEVSSARRGGRAGGDQRCMFFHCAVTIDAVEFDGGAGLGVKLPIAMN